MKSTAKNPKELEAEIAAVRDTAPGSGAGITTCPVCEHWMRISTEQGFTACPRSECSALIGIA